MQVDVAARLGAVAPATPTGIGSMDRVLAGGLRAGTVLLLTGGPGVGKSALALLLAYMAARTRAAVLLTSVALDPTEVMARLAARALHREFPEAVASYGAIWAGQAWQDDRLRRQVGAAVEAVVKKVGNFLHLYCAEPFASTAELTERTAYLWGRHERVVLVVDGVEPFRAAAGGEAHRALTANSGFESRVSQVGYELQQIAARGCAVVVTAQLATLPLIAPAATVAGELSSVAGEATVIPERLVQLGTRPVELAIRKNRLGPTALIPMRFIAGAGVFEERTP
jgi:energy-coupling factor transporter ATP-binding protein EcfA2